MKKSLFILFIMAMRIYATSAQLVVQNVDNTSMNSFTKSDEMRKALSNSASRQATGFDNRYEGVQGSPFLFEEWMDGTLTLNDSAIVQDKMKYKFELVNNTVWLKLSTGEERILYNRELLSLKMNTKDGGQYLIKKVRLPDVTDKNHFSIVLFENENMSLVKDVRKVFRKADLEDKGIVTVGKAYDRFEEVVKYFVKKENKSYFEEISLKKSNFISLVPKSHEQMVEQFCKSNEIHKNMNDTDAVKLVQYISSLK